MKNKTEYIANKDDTLKCLEAKAKEVLDLCSEVDLLLKNRIKMKQSKNKK